MGSSPGSDGVINSEHGSALRIQTGKGCRLPQDLSREQVGCFVPPHMCPPSSSMFRRAGGRAGGPAGVHFHPAFPVRVVAHDRPVEHVSSNVMTSSEERTSAEAESREQRAAGCRTISVLEQILGTCR